MRIVMRVCMIGFSGCEILYFVGRRFSLGYVAAFLFFRFFQRRFLEVYEKLLFVDHQKKSIEDCHFCLLQKRPFL